MGGLWAEPGGQVPGRGVLRLEAAGAAPGRTRVLAAPQAAGGAAGWTRPAMDKLKKVLSGQDTEDRGGLSEVSAPWRSTLPVALSSAPRLPLPGGGGRSVGGLGEHQARPQLRRLWLLAGEEKDAGLLGFLGK